LEAAVQAVDETLIVYRLIDDRWQHDSGHLLECDLGEFDDVGCGAILQHVGCTLQQCLNGRLLGLLCDSQGLSSAQSCGEEKSAHLDGR
jgi:hypothetical protein